MVLGFTGELAESVRGGYDDVMEAGIFQSLLLFKFECLVRACVFGRRHHDSQQRSGIFALRKGRIEFASSYCPLYACTQIEMSCEMLCNLNFILATMLSTKRTESDTLKMARNDNGISARILN